MASLQQIADELCVSPSLVSKVLNRRLGNSGARPELAEQIFATAKRLGYRRNANAVALKSGRQQVIAVLIHRHGSAGSGLVEALLSGVSIATRDLKQRQIITFYDDLDDFTEVTSSLHAGSVDGLIVSGVRHPNVMEALLVLRKTGVPVVSVYNRAISDLVPNVGMLDEHIIRTATDHLLDRGYRRILHVSSLKDREVGYTAALAARNIDFDPQLINFDRGDDNTFVAGNGQRAVSQALEAGVEFDAVCAQSDTQAIGAMHELIRRGFKIPADLPITGVDNSPFSRLSFVPLTSVDQRYEERGRLAVQMLDGLAKSREISSIDLDPQLVVRESSGA